MRKFLFWALVVFWVGGCTGKVVHITPSGQVEVAVFRSFTSDVSGMLQSRMEERGYALISQDQDGLIFKRLTKEGVVGFLDGIGVDMPEARIIYHVAKEENSFNLTASFALVNNPGQYNESVKYVNDHGDTVKYQKMLNKFKIDVEALPQPEIKVVKPKEPASEDEYYEVYGAYFREAEKQKEERELAEKREKEKILYAVVKKLSASDYEKNLKGYRELHSLNPENDLYRAKVAYYSSKVKEENCKTSGECSELYAAVKKLPSSDYEGNLKGYRELRSLYPANKKYQRKIEFYTQKITDQKLRNSCDIEVTNWGWHFSDGGGYIIAEGEVENLSGRRLERVKFVVRYSDANDKFITSGWGYVDFKPLLPGQRSPFKDYTSLNPAVKYGSIQFFDRRGNQLRVYSNRK